MTAANISQLTKLFRYVAQQNNEVAFFDNPKNYIEAATSDEIKRIVLSSRQVDLLKRGGNPRSTLSTDLERLMSGGAGLTWVPGAVAATAACRPAYARPTFVAQVGVPADTVPRDPVAAMIWAWQIYNPDEKIAVKDLLGYLLDGARSKTPPIPEVISTIDELLNKILA